ncbi:hypothetical protein ACFQ1F_14260 [Flaviramulus multivorans]
MQKAHTSAEVILDKTLRSTQGSRQFINRFNNWTIESNVIWNKRKFKLHIKCRNSSLFQEFPTCYIKRSVFLEIISRSEMLKFSGEKSKYTDFLHTDYLVLQLLDFRCSKIGLEGKNFVFKGNIKRKNIEELSDLYWSLEEVCLNFNSFLESVKQN